MFNNKTPIYVLILVVLVALVITATGCEGFLSGVTGSSNIETREMDYTDFTAVEVGNAFEVDVSHGNTYFVSITANDNLFEYMEIGKTGSTLYIKLKPLTGYINTTQKASIIMPDLNKLDLSGASRGDVQGFSVQHDIDFELSGASSLDIDNLEAIDMTCDLSGASKMVGDIKVSDINLDLSGASSVELNGTAKDASLDASGASHIDIAALPITSARISLSGASSATVNASGRLDGDISGASKLSYMGNPQLGNISTSGASTIRQK